MLRDLGFRVFRVRHHDTRGAPRDRRDEMARALEPDDERHGSCARCKALGYQYVSLDLQGYRLGSLNEALPPATGLVTRCARVAAAALALVFALGASCPFSPPSLEDIDSVNFALGVRDFDVAAHRPHPPGYPVYIALGKVATAIAGCGLDGTRRSRSKRGARRPVAARPGSLAVVWPLRRLRARLRERRSRSIGGRGRRSTSRAIAATAITVSCPLFWYLAVRPMSDLPGLAVRAGGAGVPAAGLVAAAPPGRRRPAADAGVRCAASGRMIVLGALLAGVSIGVRSQTLWLTVPLLLLVLFDRIGRGVAGALLGSAIMLLLGGWRGACRCSSPAAASTPISPRLAPRPARTSRRARCCISIRAARNAAFALLRTFVDPWDSPALAIVVLGLVAAGFAQVQTPVTLPRRRRLSASMAAIVAQL